jgi:hypothetical protein
MPYCHDGEVRREEARGEAEWDCVRKSTLM